MPTTVKLKMNTTDHILALRGLNTGGPVQQFFTSEVARRCDPLIPMKTGMLKNNRIIGVDSIKYVEPYSRKQYFENKGMGMQGLYVGGLRGKMWDKRCMTLYGRQIVGATAKMAGGRAK